MSTLYIVSTPIGNLKDISLRALEILKEVDLICCEDSRTTLKLLSHYGICKPLFVYHQHSQSWRTDKIIDFLAQGKKIALVSEAGTPGICDPGNRLIEEVLKVFPFLKIVPIPGPCALVAALSICGFPADRFLFMGFPPSKKKRKEFFEKMASSEYTVVFYESPFRILKTLQDLNNFLQDPTIVVAREMTKKFETIYRGKTSEILGLLKKEKPRGEFVLVVKR